MMKILSIVMIILVIGHFFAVAQISRTLSYQGVLTDSSGTPRADGNYNFTFNLYDSGSAGTLLWDETKTLPTKRGLFSTVLGDVKPFPDSLQFDRQYWLNISVQGVGELSPRVALVSVPYAINAMRADTAQYALSSISNYGWNYNDSSISTINKYVAIGADNPEWPLQIGGLIGFETYKSSPNAGAIRFGDNTGWKFHIGRSRESAHAQRNYNTEGVLMTIKDNGNIGIGTTNPARKLDVRHSYAGGAYVANFMKTQQGPGHINLQGGDGGGRTYLDFDSDHFGIYTSNNTQSSWYHLTINGGNGIMEFDGRTKTKILEITGGSDLAEPFPVSGEEIFEEGSVVVIDESNPGHVMLSSEPYDNKVAGVVSGAGGIQPGLTLKQEGIMEGNQNIALAGRVYVKATAMNGYITPGDLLTTSDIPGHAMKATDKERSFGAIIGKAMSSLKAGEGLVLVLVNLQ